MKLIIAGSRTVIDYNIIKFCVELSDLNSITEVVSGTAKGVDLFGEQYANENKIIIKRFKPDWDKFGKRAGYLRNEEMGIYADALLAVWNGVSKGTFHMINIMDNLNKPCYIFTLGEDIV